MEKDVFVYVDLDGVSHLVGHLWARVRKNKEGATFEYNDAWLKHPNRFSLEPALKPGPGPFQAAVAILKRMDLQKDNDEYGDDE